MTAGSGDDTATATIVVKETTKPTTKPTIKPTTKPTASPGVSTQPTTSSSASPGGSVQQAASPTASPGDSGDETSPSSEGEEITVKPKEISRNEDTGVITVIIDVDDLPESTVAIETPRGETLYVSDAKDGLLVIEATEDDVDTNGDISLNLLDDEMTPMSMMNIHVLDENEEITIIGTGVSVWIIIVSVAAGLLVLGAVLWILIRRRNKQGDTMNK